ncbi:hypothetical protein TYRP_000926 [Tyrophagus putrescentiae]|nr:hypothetical protein TYRP_000926 [Tyrophagus putrescentiae]
MTARLATALVTAVIVIGILDVHILQQNIKQRLTLASLGSPKTPAYSDLARFAREALVGGRFW